MNRTNYTITSLVPGTTYNISISVASRDLLENSSAISDVFSTGKKTVSC